MIDEVQQTLWQPMVSLWTKVAEFLLLIVGYVVAIVSYARVRGTRHRDVW